MKHLIFGAVLALAPVMATADDDIVKVPTAKSVSAATDALVAAVEGAGAKVFARVDHGAGARSIGADIGDSQLVIFGNPKLGTPAIADNRLVGLELPLKVLVYQDEDNKVWLAYENPEEMLDDLVSEDAGYIPKMTGALQKLTGKAAGN